MAPEFSEEAIVTATGHDRAWWRATLDEAGAADLPHGDIVRHITAHYAVSPWWAQTVTVEYERMTGRRVVGQTCTGDFQATVTKTLPGDKDRCLAKWIAHVGPQGEFDGTPWDGEPRVTESPKWRYWRVDLADGTRTTVMFSDKPKEKTSMAVNVEKLPDTEAVARWKEYWKPTLAAFAES